MSKYTLPKFKKNEVIITESGWWGIVPKESKYHSKKVKVDGIEFDSKKEAKRYQELKILKSAGVIECLELQKVFELQPSFKKNGKTYRKITYKADFSYFDNEKGKYIIEDVKGFKTEVYKLKKKMFEYKFKDIEIKEI